MLWRFPALWRPAPSRCVVLPVALAPWSQPAVGPPGLPAQPRVRPAAPGVSAFGSPPELVRLHRAKGEAGASGHPPASSLGSTAGPRPGWALSTPSPEPQLRHAGGRGLPHNPAGLRRRPRTCTAHVFLGRLPPAREPPLGNGCSRRRSRCADLHFSLLPGEGPRPTTQSWVKVWGPFLPPDRTPKQACRSRPSPSAPCCPGPLGRLVASVSAVPASTPSS